MLSRYCYMDIYGVDMALSHFAIVDSTGTIICAQANTNNMDSSPYELRQVAETAASYIPPGALVNIDWDVNIGSFGSKKPGSKKFNNPKVGVIITAQIMLFAAIAYCQCHADIAFVTPAQVRRCLGLPTTMSKEDVHKIYWSSLPLSVQNPKPRTIKQVRGDIIDAYLLTLVNGCARG